MGPRSPVRGPVPSVLVFALERRFAHPAGRRPLPVGWPGGRTSPALRCRSGIGRGKRSMRPTRPRAGRRGLRRRYTGTRGAAARILGGYRRAAADRGWDRARRFGAADVAAVPGTSSPARAVAVASRRRSPSSAAGSTRSSPGSLHGRDSAERGECPPVGRRRGGGRRRGRGRRRRHRCSPSAAARRTGRGRRGTCGS